MSMTIAGVSSNVDILLKDSDLFTTVLDHAPTQNQKFEGYPAVSHYYEDGEGSFATVSQNRRVFEYIVDIFLLVDPATSPSDEYQEAYAMIDSILAIFDQSIDLSKPAIGLARACDILRPAPSRLARISLDEGPGFAATIRLFCEGDITFRNS